MNTVNDSETRPSQEAVTSANPSRTFAPMNIEEELGNDLQSVNDLLFRAAVNWPQATALSAMGANISYRRLLDETSAVAEWLKSQGLKSGDRVGVALPNVLANPVAILGIIRANMTAVSLNPLYTADELKHVINDSGIKCLIAFEPLVAIATKAVKDSSVKQMVVVKAGDYLGLKSPLVNFIASRKSGYQKAPSSSVPWSTVVRTKHPAISYPAESNPDSHAIIIYSGGTSGVPKGVPMTHRGLLAGLAQQKFILSEHRQRLAERQYVLMLAAPMYHILGLGSYLYALYQGGTAIMIMNPADRKSMVKEWRKKPVSSFPAVNSLFNALLEEPSFHHLDFSSLIFSLGAGMAVSRETARRWKELTGCDVTEGYGLTETNLVTCNPAGANRPGSVGLPIPGIDICLLDDNDQIVPLGQSGEICVRGDSVLRNYLSGSAESAYTSNGYFRTGDIGKFDVDGYLYIVDRKKDMIICSGFNVYPGDVERVINSVPGVYESAVIARRDQKSGEVPVAYVVRREDITESAVMDACKAHLTGYKRPREVIFIDELPKSPVGKILRRKLSEQLQSSPDT